MRALILGASLLALSCAGSKKPEKRMSEMHRCTVFDGKLMCDGLAAGERVYLFGVKAEELEKGKLP